MALEVPYFSSGCFKDLCFHCGGEDDLQKVPGAYPICAGCSSTKTLALKRKHVNLKDTVQGKKKKNWLKSLPGFQFNKDLLLKQYTNKLNEMPDDSKFVSLF